MPRGYSRLDEARLQKRLWTPYELKALGRLSTWYTTEGPMLALATAGQTQTWKDSSGLGNDLHQVVTSTQEPIFLGTGWVPNGSRCLKTVNATGQYLELTSTLAYSGGTGQSFALVAQNDGSALDRTLWAGNTGGMQLRISASQLPEILRRNQASLITAAAVSTGFHVFGCSVSTSSSVLWVDGASTSNGTDPALTAAVQWMYTGGGDNFQGLGGESLSFQGVWTLRERQLIDGYLAWRNGLVYQLVNTHPFKNRPPLIGV